MNGHRLHTAAQVVAAAVCGLAIPAGLALGADVEPRSLFVVSADGSDSRSVTRVEGFPICGAPRWSHDGRRLAFEVRQSPGAAARLFIVNPDGGNLVAVGPGGRPDWSPDDKQFAFDSGSNPALKEGVWVKTVDGGGDQWMIAGRSPRWSPDGSLIALVDDGGLRVLDQIEFDSRSLFDGDANVTAVAEGVAWSPDGQQLAVALERDGRWEVAVVGVAGSESSLRTRLVGKADGLSWSPDGKTLAAALWNEKTKEHRLHLLDVEGEGPPRELPGQQGDNRQPAFSPDGKSLAFVSTRPAAAMPAAAVAAGAVKFDQISAFDTGGTCYSLALAPDGRSALLGGNMGNRRLQVWDVRTQVVERQFPMLGVFVAVSPDGVHGACIELVGNRGKDSVTLFRLADGAHIRDLPAPGPIWFVEFSAGGTRLICGSEDGVARVFDVATGKQLAELKHEQRVAAGAISPDGRTVAISSGDKKVYVWDVAAAQTLRVLDHPDLVWSVAFAPNGRQLATGTGAAPLGNPAQQRVALGNDNTVRLWDLASGKRLAELKGHERAVAGLAFSPNSRRLASGSFDGTLRLWDVEGQAELCRAGGKSWIFKVVYSNDGKLVLASGGNARINMSDRRLVDFPSERVRVFEIVPDDEATESPAKP